jgi:hypothetical protein
MSESRVPTSEPQRGGWSLETAIDYLLGVGNEKDAHLRTLIQANDRRYEERFGASQKALELGLAGTKSEISVALAASKEAVLKAENATEKRFESVNEFRATLDNQQRTLIPRSEVAVMIQGVEEKIANLTKQFDLLQSEKRERRSEEKGIQGGWGYAVGVVGFVLAIISLWMIVSRAVQP